MTHSKHIKFSFITLVKSRFAVVVNNSSDDDFNRKKIQIFCAYIYVYVCVFPTYMYACVCDCKLKYPEICTDSKNSPIISIWLQRRSEENGKGDEIYINLFVHKCIGK